MGPHTSRRPDEPRRQVALFITCLVDLMRPSAGFAAVKLLQDAGCDVSVPDLQTCCGQPAYNSGDRAAAKDIALLTIRKLKGDEAIVAPSASCAAMLKVHYPTLFAGDPELHAEAVAFAARVHELIAFLVDVCGQTAVPARFDGRIAYHQSCASLREMPSDARPLLRTIEGASVVELEDSEACCGFGGLFSVKYEEISSALAAKKTAAIDEANVDILAGPDLGCLLHLAGKLSREGSKVSCRHVAEVLAGDTSAPPIGRPA